MWVDLDPAHARPIGMNESADAAAEFHADVFHCVDHAMITTVTVRKPLLPAFAMQCAAGQAGSGKNTSARSWHYTK
jgi:hypothetical protein